MSLHFGFNSPRDVLAKAERDFARLREAMRTLEDEAVGDALFDFAVAISSVRDWLRAHSSPSFTAADVNKAAKDPSLEVFRDIANGTKHRALSYTPDTLEVLVSAQPAHGTMLPHPDAVPLYTTGPKLKAISSDGTRQEIVRLARTAVEVWTAFLDQHGV